LRSCGTKATPSALISRGARPSNRCVVQQHAAAMRAQHAGDHLEQRGLAGAVGADDADDLAALDGQVHALQDLVGRAVAGHDGLDGQEPHRRRPM
jgi:hypothetical protein